MLMLSGYSPINICISSLIFFVQQSTTKLIFVIYFTGQRKLGSDSEGSDGGLYMNVLSPNLKQSK